MLRVPKFMRELPVAVVTRSRKDVSVMTEIKLKKANLWNVRCVG